MRSADSLTLIRTLLVFVIAYAIFVMFNPWVTIALIAIMFLMDAIDGFAAYRDVSKGEVSFNVYVQAAVFGNGKAKRIKAKWKPKVIADSRIGARIDIAGDRITEYVLWIVFVVLNLVPVWVLFLIVVRHSFVDALMGARGTSSRVDNAFTRFVYTSSFGRSSIGALKAVTFSYLTLVYVSGWPYVWGEILVGLLAGYILIRGVAEAFEALKNG